MKVAIQNIEYETYERRGRLYVKAPCDVDFGHGEVEFMVDRKTRQPRSHCKICKDNRKIAASLSAMGGVMWDDWGPQKTKDPRLFNGSQGQREVLLFGAIVLVLAVVAIFLKALI